MTYHFDEAAFVLPAGSGAAVTAEEIEAEFDAWWVYAQTIAEGTVAAGSTIEAAPTIEERLAAMEETLIAMLEARRGEATNGYL